MVEEQADRHSPLDRTHQRIGLCRLHDRVAEREVDQLEVEGFTIGYGMVDCRNHVAGVAGSFVVENLVAHDSGFLRNTLEPVVRELS